MFCSIFIHDEPLSYTRRTCFLLFKPDAVPIFPSCASCIHSKCIFCAHLRWSENEVCSGALLACCNFVELNIDLRYRQLKPSLKSMAQYFFCYLKSPLVENVPLGESTTRVHFAYCTQGRASSTQTCKRILLQCK